MQTIDLNTVKVAPGPVESRPYRMLLALMDAVDEARGEDPLLKTPLEPEEFDRLLREGEARRSGGSACSHPAEKTYDVVPNCVQVAIPAPRASVTSTL